MSAGGDSSLISVLVAVSVNALITVAKYVGWFLTGSPSLLAEAIHSTADVGNQFLLWIGIKASARAASPEHPYGWGNARYLWNLKSAMGIFFLGCGVTVYHGVHAGVEVLEGAHPLESPSSIGLVVLVVSFLLETVSLAVAWVGINKDRGETPLLEFVTEGDDPTGVGVLLEDLAAVLGVFIALAGVGLSHLLHSPWPDIVATVLIGVLLGALAIFLARTNGRLLIGVAARPEDRARIQAALEQDDVVERIEDLKTEVIGQGRLRVKAEVDLCEKLIATRMLPKLKEDVARLKDGEEPLRVLVDVVGRSVRLAGHEIQRLDHKVREVCPNAAHVDLELL